MGMGYVEIGRHTVGYQRWLVVTEQYGSITIDIVDERFGSCFDAVSHRSITLTPADAKALAAELQRFADLPEVIATAKCHA